MKQAPHGPTIILQQTVGKQSCRFAYGVLSGSVIRATIMASRQSVSPIWPSPYLVIHYAILRVVRRWKLALGREHEEQVAAFEWAALRLK